MNAPKACLIYDFDKTLSPKDMQEFSFLPEVGMEPGKFWAECRRFSLANGADGVLAYMYKMLEKAREAGKPITQDRLRSQGEKIEFYPGVTDWFERVGRMGRALGIEVEHYIISSGLREIIEGSRISWAFKAVFAASFCYDQRGQAYWPATAVNYTSKTQYLFRINKGILDVTNDVDLNNYTPEERRAIPFPNMIYVGDGLTDVPCMKLVRLKGGYSIAVYAPGGDSRIADDMILQNRVNYAMEADYREGSELERAVHHLLRRIAEADRCVRLHNEHLDAALERKKRGGGESILLPDD